MRLITALELAEECGLETVGEAIRNVTLHSTQLFVLENVHYECAQLNYEWNRVMDSTDFNTSSLVTDVMEYLRKE